MITKPIDLQPIKDALQIVKTGEDANGNSYTNIGKLNQAAWIGEHSDCLINEIERLRAIQFKFAQVAEFAIECANNLPGKRNHPLAVRARAALRAASCA